MGKFLKSLIEAGKVPLYLDWRTGSLLDLSGTGTVVTHAPAGVRWRRGGLWLNGTATSTLTVPNSAAIQLTDGTAMLYMESKGYSTPLTHGLPGFYRRDSYSIFYPTVNGFVGTYDWGTFSYKDTSTAVTQGPEGPITLACGFDGANTEIYKDGASLGSVAQTFPSQTRDLLIGMDAHGRIGNYFAFILIDEQLSDVDVARLHRDLYRSPNLIRRPRKHFSFPFPAKTPAQYSTDGVLLDISGSVVRGEAIDLTGNGYDVDDMGDQDIRRGRGPFTESIGFNGRKGGATPGAVAYGGGSQLCVSGWVKPMDGQNAYVISESGVVYTSSGRWILSTVETIADTFCFGYWAGSIAAVETYTGSAPEGKWSHVVAVYNDAARLDEDRLLIYVDGRLSVGYRHGTNPVGSASLADEILYVGARNRTLFGLNGSVSALRVQTSVPTSDEVRSDYLVGAKKLLLDMWLDSSGASPVSIDGATAGEVYGWQVVVGSWLVVEETASKLKPGERYLENETWATHRVAAKSEYAYGTWYFKASFAGTNERIMVVGSTSSDADADHDGYSVYVDSSGDVHLVRTDNGAQTTIASSTLPSLADDTDYEFWVTRRGDGVFVVWLLGGTYTGWTPVISHKDATYSTSAWVGAYFTQDGSKLYGIRQFLGEMTPWEGAKLKLLSTAEEPLVWVDNTSIATTQDWDMEAAVGAINLFDWGDGHWTAWEATGGTDTILHSYTGVGPWRVRMLVPDVTSVERAVVINSLNNLQGEFPDWNDLPNLSYIGATGQEWYGVVPNFSPSLTWLLISDNTSTDGVLPSFVTATSLERLYALNLGFTSYAGGVAPLSLDYIHLSGSNSFPQAEVDAVIHAIYTNLASRPVTGQLYIDGSNAAPSATGAAEAAAITAHGWTVTHN